MIVSSCSAKEEFDFGDSAERDLIQAFQSWYCNESYFDAVISCRDGVQVKAHKLLLSAFSDYFEAAFLGPMSKNVNGIVTLHLHFLSSSVQFLFDCLYKQHRDDDFDIDMLDFISLCHFANVPEGYYKVGLQIAAQKLSLENAFPELNRTTSGADIVPRWLSIVSHYILVSLEERRMNIEELSIMEPTTQSVLALLSCPTATLCSPQITMQLLEFMITKDRVTSPTVQDIIQFHIQQLMDHYKDASKDAEAVERLQKRCISAGYMPNLCTQGDDGIPSQRMQDIGGVDKELVLQISQKRREDAVEFVFYPDQMETTDGEFELRRYIKSIEGFFGFCHLRCRLNVPRIRVRYFMWKMYICAVLDDIKIFQVLKYDWVGATWVRLTYIMLTAADCCLKIQSCFVKNDKLVLLFDGMNRYQDKPDRFRVYAIDLGNPKNRSMRTYPRHYKNMKVVEHSHSLLGFITPYSYIDLTDLTVDTEEVNISNSEEASFLNCVVSFQGKILHFFNGSVNGGLYVDQLHLETDQNRWMKESTKLDENILLVNAFVANGQLFVMYKKKEDLAENDGGGDDGGSDDNSDNESIDEYRYDDENRETLYIKECFYKEVEPGRNELALLDDGEEIGPLYFFNCSRTVVVNRNVFPLDVLPLL